MKKIFLIIIGLLILSGCEQMLKDIGFLSKDGDIPLGTNFSFSINTDSGFYIAGATVTITRTIKNDDSFKVRYPVGFSNRTWTIYKDSTVIDTNGPPPGSCPPAPDDMVTFEANEAKYYYYYWIAISTPGIYEVLAKASSVYFEIQ